jgi:methylase of polypeptide subunit release factors
MLMNPSLVFQAEVAEHEPWQALDGGQGTGSAMLLKISRAAVAMLRPGGFIAFETAGMCSKQKRFTACMRPWRWLWVSCVYVGPLCGPPRDCR